MAVTTVVIISGVPVQNLTTVVAKRQVRVFPALPPGPTITTGFVREHAQDVQTEAIGRGRLRLAVRPIPVVLVRQDCGLGFVKVRVVGLGGFTKPAVTTVYPKLAVVVSIPEPVLTKPFIVDMMITHLVVRLLVVNRQNVWKAAFVTTLPIHQVITLLIVSSRQG